MNNIPTSQDRSTTGNPTRSGLSALLRHDVHPVVQFIKYGIVGGLATSVHVATFFLCGWYLWPCLTQNDITVRLLGLTAPTVSESVRVWHAIYCNAIAFTLSNTVCYLLNRLFVFKPGRHHWALEFLYFFGGSGISLVIGTGVQTFLMSHHGMQTTYAFASNLVSSLLINFAMRKYVIFKG